MKKYLITGLLVASVLPLGVLSNNAIADTTYFFDGVYGKADQKNSISGSDTIAATDTSSGIRAGFYLAKPFGIEIVKMDYGSAEDSFVDGSGDLVTNSMGTEWLGVGIHGNMKIGPKTRLVGRIGLAAWELSFEEINSGFPDDRFFDKDEGIDAYLGIGLQFDIEDNVRLSLEYETMEFSAIIGAADTDHSISNIGVSLGVLF